MIEVAGRGLFGGAPSRVRLEVSEGPVELVVAGRHLPRSSWHARAPLLSTEIEAKGVRVRSVEHLFAAMAGLGVQRGVRVTLLEGDELPLLDGSASAWTTALGALHVPPGPSSQRIARAARFTAGGSVYELEPAAEIRVEVELRTRHPRLARHARWSGEANEFAAHIAPARTFVFEADLPSYLERGADAFVSPEQVVVVGERVHAAGRAAALDEPVRHKLLDLLGDLYAHGGPPRGLVRALAPGHARTHEVMARARAQGVLAD